MRRVHGVNALKDRLVIRYSDDTDPPWVWGREVDVSWKESSHVRRVVRLTANLLELLVGDPQAIPANEEILQEWIARLLREHSQEGPGAS